MNWDNYLLEEKAPGGAIAHLGILDGTINAPFDLSALPVDAHIVSMSTPLKKFKLGYTNLSSLKGNNQIEAISVNDIDEERLAVFATLPHLKYLQISVNSQNEIPDLSALQSLEVLILANIKKVENIHFIEKLKSLKTLYIYGFNNLYDLSPIAGLTGLKELCIDHGKMSGTGKPVKSIEPLTALTQLQYLRLGVTIGEKNPDWTALHGLKKLRHLWMLPRYLKDKEKEILKKEFPLVVNL
ncbi:hypothetical protein ACLOAU_24175 [Niabella sp. CJ426]|uniref:hypothetical protein n=1 Tax=Niabella sp. CJ426 TaxID=3393740 RepID=UPI003D086AE5